MEEADRERRGPGKRRKKIQKGKKIKRGEMERK